MAARIRMIAVLAAALSAALVPAGGGAQQPGPMPRLWFSGWAGAFTDVGGFSQGPSDFFQFDGAFATGAAVHVRVGSSLVVGGEAVLARPDYTRFERTQAIPLSSGRADVLSLMATARAQGVPGRLGVFLTAGAGVFYWNVPDLPERNVDPSLMAGLGLEFGFNRRVSVFAQYDQWWVFHEKEQVERNTANHNLLRFGGRLGV